MCPQAPTPGSRSRWGLSLVLLLSLALNAIPIWWGLPSNDARTWAFDEIPPHHTGLTLETRHRGRYPPLHYAVLRVAYQPIRWLDGVGVLDFDDVQRRSSLQIVGRSLSVIMATLTVFLVYQIGRLLFGRHDTALLAAITTAFVVPFVFFAKTINLEAPYLFWFTLSIFFFIRIQQGYRDLDYLAFATTMVFAITTKDQAYALYILPPAVLLLDLHRHRREVQGDGAGSLLRTLFDRRLLGSAFLSVVLFALIHGLFTDWHPFVRHVQIITGKASQPSQMFEHSVAGHVDMLHLAVLHVAFSMGWLLLIPAVIGVVLAWRERRWQLLSLLVFPVSYYLFFIVPILYHRVRYFLPFCVVLSLFAALALTRLKTWPVGRTWIGGAAIVVVLIFSFLRPMTLDQEMLFDSRYAVEAWLVEQDEDDKVIYIGFNRPLLPRGRRVRSLQEAALYGAEYLRLSEADYVVVNESERSEGPREKFMQALVEGELNFRVLFREQYQPWPFRLDRGGLATNLSTVNPMLTVLEREGPWEQYEGP